jgi:hypothetical protein
MDFSSLSLGQLVRMAADPANAAVVPLLERRISALRVGGADQPAAAGRGKPRKRAAPAPPRDGLNSIRLTLYGAPRTKKNHAARLVHAGKPCVVPSAAWMAWRDSVRGQVHPWMRLCDQKYNCEAVFFRDADRGDANGYYQGLADVLEELEVVSNDRLLVSWDGSALLVDRTHPRVEITLTPTEAQ